MGTGGGVGSGRHPGGTGGGKRGGRAASRLWPERLAGCSALSCGGRMSQGRVLDCGTKDGGKREEEGVRFKGRCKPNADCS